MKNLSPSANKNVFLIVCLCLVVALIIAVVGANGDEAMHRQNYERYEAANKLFEDRQFQESYAAYRQLAATYRDSYILELKMAVCAMNMEMWVAAVEHTRRVIELYPMLSKDMDLMDALAHSLNELGQHEAADKIEDFMYNRT